MGCCAMEKKGLHAKQALMGGSGITVPMLDPGARRGRVVNDTHRLFYARKREAG